MKLLFDVFNTACNNIAASFLKVGDESMREIRFRTTAKGNLPHLSYVLRKPETLGNKFKIVSCSVTGALLFIEVQRGKEGMKDSRYQQEFGATAACMKRMMEETKGIGQRSKKGGAEGFFPV